MSSQVDIAKAIATLAHAGQVDKTGRPYIEHPARVAATVARRMENRSESVADDVIATAWLHDVIEDTSVTSDDLLAAGVDRYVVARVAVLTHGPHESAEDYYDRIIEEGGWIPEMVKLADIDDNMRPERLALLDDATVVRLVKKYAKGRRLLRAAVVEPDEETE